MNRIEQSWNELTETFAQHGVRLDEDVVETLRHAFIAGAVSYRRILNEALDDRTVDDDVALRQAADVDAELDEVAEALYWVEHQPTVRH